MSIPTTNESVPGAVEFSRQDPGLDFELTREEVAGLRIAAVLVASVVATALLVPVYMFRNRNR